MLERVSGACLRAAFVALLVALPSLMLPQTVTDTTTFVVLLAFVAGVMTFSEYYSTFPSVIEFRFSAPFNRMRFGIVFMVTLYLATMMRAEVYPSQIGQILENLARLAGQMLDFPYSPVRLAVLSLPADAPLQTKLLLRDAAAVSYLISGAVALYFLLMTRILGWPMRTGAFNVWVNLPMFDPTKGDVLIRLNRDARVHSVLGFILPFLLPAVIKVLLGWNDSSILLKPQVLIWAMVIWACLPATMIMRGIAIGRVAEMISEKRRRAYAEARARGVQTV